MTNTALISAWLPLLRELAPPAGLILVGAGAGISPWAQLLQEWNLPGTILVEPDDAQFLQLQKNVSRFGCWRLHKQLVAGMEEEVVFYQASNSAESGLLDPESLRGIWPNIKTRQRQRLSAVTLASLQQEEGQSANWLMVDCLPALPVIQGAAELLDAFDVIAVRVVFDKGALGVGTASHSELESYLSKRGYRCIATETGRHPAVGHALYVRDTQAEIRKLQHQHAQQNQACQAELKKIAQQNNIAQQLAGKLHQQIDQLTKSQQIADELGAERKQQVDQLKHTNAIQAEQLAQSRNDMAAAIDKYTAEIKQLTNANEAAHLLCAARMKEIEQLMEQKELAASVALHSADWEENDCPNCIFGVRQVGDGKVSNIQELDNLSEIALKSGKAAKRSNVRLGNKSINIIVRADSKADAEVLNKVFVDKEIEFEWRPQGKSIRKLYTEILEAGRSPLIVDAGANIGATSRYLAHRYSKAKILAIEPDIDNCSLLVYNCEKINLDLFQGGLADKKRRLFLHDPGQGEWAYQVKEHGGGTSVDCIGMNEIISRYNKKNGFEPLILKMDIEGGEKRVFEKGCNTWLSKIPCLIIELHDWLFPGNGVSSNFLRAVSALDFELIPSGENIICFNRNLLIA